MFFDKESLGEKNRGGERNERFYNDTFGEGVGSGIVVNGEVVYSHEGALVN